MKKMGKKKAFLVAGPESSGTRITTEILVNAGCFGDSTHSQRLDQQNFTKTPERLVFRRSIPHSDSWPNLANITCRMQAASYKVKAIITVRDWHAMSHSQVNSRHANNTQRALKNIKKAYRHIFLELSKLDIDYFFVNYESLINNPNQYQRWILDQLEIAHPLSFVKISDGNQKYYK